MTCAAKRGYSVPLKKKIHKACDLCHFIEFDWALFIEFDWTFQIRHFNDVR